VASILENLEARRPAEIGLHEWLEPSMKNSKNEAIAA
jgi:hypothetical protein